VEENFSNGNYIERSDELRATIDASVAADENAFYGYDNFIDNLYLDVSDLIQYPGIVNLMDGRSDFLLNYEGVSGSPTVIGHSHFPQIISPGNALRINVSTENANSVFLHYRFSEGELFTKVAMADDGISNDGSAGDGIFGYEVPNSGNNIQYYFWVENDLAGRFSPERAATEFYSLFAPVELGAVVINEIMASNVDTQADEDGEYDDWIELFNTSDLNLSLAGMYLSDNPSNLDKWACPNIEIAAGDYLIIWADENSGQGNLHANFQLSSLGESLYLSYADGTILDSVQYGMQNAGKSTGRIPNGVGSFEELFPTFGYDNDEMTGMEERTLSSRFLLYPNPVKDLLYIRPNVNWGNAGNSENFEDQSSTIIQLFSMDGRELGIPQAAPFESGFSLDVSHCEPGIYILNINKNNQTSSTRIIIE